MTLVVSAAAVLPAALTIQDPATQGGAAASDQDPQGGAVADRLKGLNELVEQFSRVNETLAVESRDWRLGRQRLQDQVMLINAEISDLEQATADARENLAETDAKFAELTEEKARLAKATEGLEAVIGELEAQVKALVARVPEPLKEKLTPSLNLIPASEEQAEERKLDLARRFPPLLAILAQIEKFQTEVHLVIQTVPVSNGEKAECSVVYLGLGQAYYVSRDRTFAGVGQPTADRGWTWLANNDIAAQVSEVIAILNGEKPASYVELPVQLQFGSR